MPEYAISNNDVLEVVVGQTYVGQRLLNVLHWQLTGAGSVVDGPAELTRLKGVLTVGINSLTDLLGACQVDSLQHAFIRLQVVAPIRRRYQQWALTSAGTVASGGLPPNVSMVLTKQTDRVGRGRAGRVSVGGVPQSFIASGALTPGAITAMTNLGNVVDDEFVINAGPMTWKPCVLSGDDNPSQPKVLGCVAQLTSRVVRRRTVGQGI